MIAADTSAWIDFSKGSKTDSAKKLEAVLEQGSLVMPMPVLFELLSGPGLTKEVRSLLLQIPKLETILGFWERAGDLRSSVLKRGLKARAMDCLVAQNCMDHGVSLIASDSDFRHFVRHGLKLLRDSN